MAPSRKDPSAKTTDSVARSRAGGLKINLVALGSAAVFTVYAAGYERTASAASRFTNDADDGLPPPPGAHPGGARALRGVARDARSPGAERIDDRGACSRFVGGPDSASVGRSRDGFLQRRACDDPRCTGRGHAGGDSVSTSISISSSFSCGYRGRCVSSGRDTERGRDDRISTDSTRSTRRASARLVRSRRGDSTRHRSGRLQGRHLHRVGHVAPR